MGHFVFGDLLLDGGNNVLDEAGEGEHEAHRQVHADRLQKPSSFRDTCIYLYTIYIYLFLNICVYTILEMG